MFELLENELNSVEGGVNGWYIAGATTVVQGITG